MSKSIARVISFIITVILLMPLISGCKQPNEALEFLSFRDIPGVTEQEILAIEALQESFSYFSYAMPLSTEAFIDERGEVRGFSALFCQFLTGLFEIEFRPQVTEWRDIFDGLKTGE